jgi:hypothetical protein
MRTEKYIEQKKRLPDAGRHIMGRSENDNIIVYQAFNNNIAEFAVNNQKFGGPHYSFNRMSWIKPGFLWMMYRAGWASKDNQQRILAISLPITHFKVILSQATLTSFDKNLFRSPEEWKTELDKTEVRLQWDPDHDPLGNKQERKAVQIGMKGSALNKFCTEWITKIEDITGFVKDQYSNVTNNGIENLFVPYEEIIRIKEIDICNRIGISKE